MTNTDNNNAQVVLRHYNLDTAAGNHPEAIRDAVLTGKSGFRIYSDQTVCKLDGNPGAYPILGQIGANEAAQLSPERLLFRIQAVLQPPEGIATPESALLCLPASDSARRVSLEKSLLPHARHLLGQAGINHITEADEATLPEQWAQAWQRLTNGEQKSLLLVSIDSLVNTATLNERLPSYDVRTTDNANGRVLSEALTALWVEAVNTDTIVDPDAIILGQPAFATEPDDCLPDQRWHQALSLAAREAIQPGTAASDPPPRPAMVMLARSQTMADELIWYQTHSSLWPLRLSPRDNLAMRKGELEAPQPEPLPEQTLLRPAMVLGDTGASTLPLAIAMATQWLRHDAGEKPLPESCLLIDTPGRQRLAMLVSRQGHAALEEHPAEPCQQEARHA